MRVILTALLTALVTLSGASLADSHGGSEAEARGAKMLKRDNDGDGRISRQEYLDSARMKAEKRFAKTDRDGDGYLERKELKGARKGMRKIDKERIKERRDKRMKRYRKGEEK